jgi:hypothetical protein
MELMQRSMVWMRPVEMQLWERHSGRVRALRGMQSVETLSGAAMMAWLAGSSRALAQDNVVATATLPRDLSPWGMYLNADPVVKAVLRRFRAGRAAKGSCR